MDNLLEQAGKALLTNYGAGGVFATITLVALVMLWRHARGLDKALADLNDARIEDAERRFQEVKALVESTTEALKAAANSISLLSVSFERTNQLNEQRLIALQTMATSIELLIKEIARMGDKIDRGLEDLRDLKRDHRG